MPKTKTKPKKKKYTHKPRPFMAPLGERARVRLTRDSDLGRELSAYVSVLAWQRGA